MSTPPISRKKTESTPADPDQGPTVSTETAQPAASTAIKTRFVCALQSTGRVGKSTALQSLASWLDFAGVPWAGVDADPEHTSFSNAFPSVAHFPLTDADSMERIFRHAASRPVCLVDFPAGVTDLVLSHIERRQVLRGFLEKGVRLTVLLFASPDPTAEASLRAVYTALKGKADFVVIRNDARFSAARFEESALARTLAEQGMPTLSLPALSSFTLREVTQAESKLRRRISLAEARGHVGTDSRLDLDYFINQVWAQWEDDAALIVPDQGLIQQRLERSTEPVAKGAAYDEFADPLDL